MMMVLFLAVVCAFCDGVFWSDQFAVCSSICRSLHAVPTNLRTGSGSIEFEEFLKMMTQKILNRDPKDEILKAFRLFDDDETGISLLSTL